MRNQLASEPSPYLLQHKDNPVDWYPWGDEAFATAKTLDRPIFLSIGYATCHWCHVMEKESFEDLEVARLMNETFINIKVDREERPDIDAIYMSACQMATGRGGWPLTIIMTADMRPFFAGTYIPKTQRYGQEGLLQMIPRIAEAWMQDRSYVIENADQFTKALRKSSSIDFSGEGLSDKALHKGFQQCQQQYDQTHGGFGEAPKFPGPEKLRFLLRYWYRTGNPKALDMVNNTLQKMRRGGMYDQIGGGFHRYSTDELWRVPHFEKMLYDQALLIQIYLEAFQVTGQQEYHDTVHSTIEYVLRELHTSEGAYCTGEDADSEGEEGKYYVWDLEEINKALQPEDAKCAVDLFNLHGMGNYLDEATRQPTGRNILYLSLDASLDDRDTLIRISECLLEHRSHRIRPLLDDKILTDWNGLMMTALARAGMALGVEGWIDHAVGCMQFIETHLMPQPGKLLHRWRIGKSGISGLLDDYAFIIDACLTLYEATYDEHYCTLAQELTATVLSDFLSDDGDFFMAPKGGESLLLRPKQQFDSAIPSGNAIMAKNLLRLARITGDPEFEDAGHRALSVYTRGLMNYPLGFCAMLSALDDALGPSHEIIITGSRDHQETQFALSTLKKNYIPNAMILSRPEFEETTSFSIHVCSGKTCELPTRDLQLVVRQLTNPIDR